MSLCPTPRLSKLEHLYLPSFFRHLRGRPQLTRVEHVTVPHSKAQSARAFVSTKFFRTFKRKASAYQSGARHYVPLHASLS
jgi:hypothetical protein